MSSLTWNKYFRWSFIFLAIFVLGTALLVYLAKTNYTVPVPESESVGFNFTNVPTGTRSVELSLFTDYTGPTRSGSLSPTGACAIVVRSDLYNVDLGVESVTGLYNFQGVPGQILVDGTTYTYDVANNSLSESSTIKIDSINWRFIGVIYIFIGIIGLIIRGCVAIITAMIVVIRRDVKSLFPIGLLCIPVGFVVWGILTYFVVSLGFWYAPAIHDFWVDSYLPMIMLVAVGPFVCWIILPLVMLFIRKKGISTT